MSSEDVAQAARTVGHDMDTERWSPTREFLVGFFGESGGADLVKVDHSRELVVGADAEDREVLRRAAVRSLAQRFGEVVARRPGAGEELRAFVAPRVDPVVGHQVVQTAHASGGSQVFQAGGSQDIRFGRR